jgi:hypothetical protein
VFDTPVLAVDLEVLGPPILELDLTADRPNALIACTLSEILPDGAVSRVTYGELNLTHRESHEHPAALEPGRRHSVRMQLSDCGHRFAAGTRLRIVISTAYWPVVWPSPERATVTIVAGSSSLLLPVRPKRPEDAALAPFAEPEAAPRLRKTQIKPGWEQRTITEDRVRGETVWELSDSDGTYRIDDIDFDRQHPPAAAGLDPSRRPGLGARRAGMAPRLFTRHMARLGRKQYRHDRQPGGLPSAGANGRR